MVLQAESTEPALPLGTTTLAAVAEEQEWQGNTGLPKEEGHKETLAAASQQAPAFNSGRSDTEEGAPDLRLLFLYARLLSPPTIDRLRASARALGASVTLPLATTIASR